MTDTEIKYVKKLKAYIKKCDKILGEWECSEISLTKLRREIAELGKQCQFELLCDPDIFEASANEHFEQEKQENDKSISIDQYMNANPEMWDNDYNPLKQ